MPENIKISLDRSVDEVVSQWERNNIPQEKFLLAANSGYSNQVFRQHSSILGVSQSYVPSSPDKLDSKQHKVKCTLIGLIIIIHYISTIFVCCSLWFLTEPEDMRIFTAIMHVHFWSFWISHRFFNALNSWIIRSHL